jgi:hypothetical protein
VRATEETEVLNHMCRQWQYILEKEQIFGLYLNICVILDKITNMLTVDEGQQSIEPISETNTRPQRNVQRQQQQQRLRQDIMNDEMVQNLQELYNMYVEQNMPYDEQLRIISMVPRSWSCSAITNIFGCTEHAVKEAREMRKNPEYRLPKTTAEPPAIRERVDPDKVKHFVDWLADSDTLVSGRIEFF